MYYVACQKFNIKITHRYLQKGHTQMECDSVHARIEHKTKNADIFTPMQWYGHIRAAKVKKPSYVVFEVKQEHLISFKDIASSAFKWDKVPVSKVHEILLDSAEPGKVFYKAKLIDPHTCFEVVVKKPGRPYNWVTFKAPHAYTGLIPLKPKLVKDLQYFVQRGLIPEDSLGYYERVTSPTFGVAPAEDPPDEIDFPEEVRDNEDVLNAFLNDEHHVDDPEEVVTEKDNSDTESICSDLLD
ncbi:SCAR-like protein 1 [Frankliniella fusca]|uniref:SCAR-like protein 1 n=1 Tax=Frankliniella fusca TaxID=407009 RepID=A0AAE1GY33_9NEOP|nr:SCAR-like protein 1 [Frankliniella fusca]